MLTIDQFLARPLNQVPLDLETEVLHMVTWENYSKTEIGGKHQFSFKYSINLYANQMTRVLHHRSETIMAKKKKNA